MPHLEWMTRNEDLQAAARVPYRLLEEVPELSYTAKDPATENMLIQGDNLEALKSLLPFYAGQVKCIFIDPPYNTRSAFEHYDDNLEHTQWLAMMVPRLELLREFLREDGSIWVTIDDNEAHYLKVIMDSNFGRDNFVASIIWRKNYSPKSSSKTISVDHDYVLVFAKSLPSWVPNPMPRSSKQDLAYKNPDLDPRGPWKPSDLSARNPYSLGRCSITCPSGRIIAQPPGGRYWSISQSSLGELAKDGRIWWGRNGNAVPQVKRFLTDVKEGVVPQTLWSYEEVGHTQDAKKEVLVLFGGESFSTPKPEKLLERIVQIATKENELVLDSFLGSGTTAAVAAKMGRRYIGIEMGGHAVTHCAPRLRKVVDGEQGGISESVGWKGGGGFRFYRLGKTIFDEAGQLDPGIRFASLAAHVWFSETRTPWRQGARGAEEAKPSPFLGVHGETAYYLLYNGVLGDKRPGGGNVITRKVLAGLPGFREHEGPKVIYGESSRLGAAALKAGGIVFKQTPYDVRAR